MEDKMQDTSLSWMQKPSKYWKYQKDKKIRRQNYKRKNWQNGKNASRNSGSWKPALKINQVPNEKEKCNIYKNI